MDILLIERALWDTVVLSLGLNTVTRATVSVVEQRSTPPYPERETDLHVRRACWEKQKPAPQKQQLPGSRLQDRGRSAGSPESRAPKPDRAPCTHEPSTSRGRQPGAGRPWSSSREQPGVDGRTCRRGSGG